MGRIEMVRVECFVAATSAGQPPESLQLHTSPPPAPQRKALGLIGAAGRRGALQSDLAAALGTENRNFFYVVKVGADCQGWLAGLVCVTAGAGLAGAGLAATPSSAGCGRVPHELHNESARSAGCAPQGPSNRCCCSVMPALGMPAGAGAARAGGEAPNGRQAPGQRGSRAVLPTVHLCGARSSQAKTPPLRAAGSRPCCSPCGILEGKSKRNAEPPKNAEPPFLAGQPGWTARQPHLPHPSTHPFATASRGSNWQGGQSSHVQTNLVHLSRFAPPNLRRGAKMTVGGAAGQRGPRIGCVGGIGPGLQLAAEWRVLLSVWLAAQQRMGNHIP